MLPIMFWITRRLHELALKEKQLRAVEDWQERKNQRDLH